MGNSRSVMHIGRLNVAYIVKGDGPTVVLLHGWGGNADSWSAVTTALARKHRVVAVDLPGFGSSDLPPCNWTLQDYGKSVLALLDELHIRHFDVIGHSFGGRLAIWLAALHSGRIKRITLVNAAGLKWDHTPFRYGLNMYVFNVIKYMMLGLHLDRKVYTLKFYSLFWGKWGYKVEPTLPLEINVHHQFLDSLLPKILCPTLVIYGENDDVTPVSFGHRLEQSIKNSALIILPSAGHFSYIDQFPRFIKIIESFLDTEIGASAQT